jgi:hypothetical protein
MSHFGNRENNTVFDKYQINNYVYTHTIAGKNCQLAAS